MKLIEETNVNASFERLLGTLRGTDSLVPRHRMVGRVQRVLGGVIKASVPGGVIGEMCLLRHPDGSELGSEIVGLAEDGALLVPFGDMAGIGAETEVVATGEAHHVDVGPDLLGRVLDGLGRATPSADRGPIRAAERRPVTADPPDPMSRRMISRPLTLGVRSLDGVLTCGEGQRIGLFAAAGGGKSTLLGMIVKHAEVDVIVVGLIGERGREVREFVEDELGPESLARAVLVVATSDRPAVERAKAAYVATTVAEYFRDQGKSVLLLMDSVTRFARAQREIGLAAGEAPTRRGFPSSVFAALPKLLERSGNGSWGSITAVYTVLVEGDDMTEPVADETRSILDGHVILSRKLAAAGHYPAVDVQSSVSRVMNKIVSEAHLAGAERVRRLLSRYDDVELLLKVGEYQAGSDPEADEAVRKIEAIRQFLRQRVNERSTLEDTLTRLDELVGSGDA